MLKKTNLQRMALVRSDPKDVSTFTIGLGDQFEPLLLVFSHYALESRDVEVFEFRPSEL
jgi:hypothetical protein